MPAPDTVTSAGAREDLALLRDAAREAGLIAMRYFGNNPQVWMKGGTSPVSDADHAADAYLRKTCLRHGRYGWLSEETADDPAAFARRTFVVDPIDGTRGFLEGLRSWCVSVAVVEDMATRLPACWNAGHEETYWALPGRAPSATASALRAPAGGTVNSGRSR